MKIQIDEFKTTNQQLKINPEMISFWIFEMKKNKELLIKKKSKK
jgi:hypothetical protein